MEFAMNSIRQKISFKYKTSEKINKLLWLGIIFIIISIVIEGISYYQNNPLNTSIVTLLTSSKITTIISSAGVALLIIALVETRFLENSLQKTSDKIVDKSSKELNNKLETTFDLIKNCKYNGMSDILPPRQDETQQDITRNIISKEIETTKFIYIISISGSDFFDFLKGARAGGGKYYEIILKRLKEAKKENTELNLCLRVLLMDPESNVAKFRNEIEKYEDSQGNIKDDVNTSLEGIKKLVKISGNKDTEKNPFIDHRLYSDFPSMGFILTDSFVFLEPYHFAPTKEFCEALKSNNLAAAELNYCTGGRIPVFKFHNKSNMYIAMKKHFESIWEYSEHQPDAPDKA